MEGFSKRVAEFQEAAANFRNYWRFFDGGGSEISSSAFSFAKTKQGSHKFVLSSRQNHAAKTFDCKLR